jgi:hypothetical protein
MGRSKERAHQLALRWWASSGRSDGACDSCNSDIAKGEGYLCQPAIVGMSVGGMFTDLSASPDLLCERCFDRSSSAQPFEGQIAGGRGRKKWWQFWK